MKKNLALMLIAVSLSGCATSSDQPERAGTGTDKLPQSACANCASKPVFYKNGQWVKP